MRIIKCQVSGFVFLFVLTVSAFAQVERADVDSSLAGSWTGSWSAAPQPQKAGTVLAGQTVREIAHISVGGDAVRIRLSNAFGASALGAYASKPRAVEIRSAHVALRLAGDQIVEGSDRVLTFAGSPFVRIPAGEEVVSDPVPLKVPSFSDLAVSLFVFNAMPASTMHAVALETNYVSIPGDYTSSLDFPFKTTVKSSYFLDGVDVYRSKKTDQDCTVVALGDSITDGIGTEAGTNARWPDELARRLAEVNPLGVLNEGIGFNRILNDQPDLHQPSVSALKRFASDVLGRPNVCYLILLEGINDIGMTPDASDNGAGGDAFVERLKAADRRMIDAAHERGIFVIGGTLTPIMGSGYDSLNHERMRLSFNDWIRHGKSFDAVIDFDAAVRDPDAPGYLKAAFDSDDHLHPNALGYRAMADSIDLSLFSRHYLKRLAEAD